MKIVSKEPGQAKPPEINPKIIAARAIVPDVITPEAPSAADMINRLYSEKSRKIILDAASHYVTRKIYPFIEKQSLIDAEMPEGRPETPTAKEIAAALEYLHSGKGPVYKGRFALSIDDDNTLDDLELESWLESGGAEWESRLVEHQKNYDGFIRGAIYREIITSAKELEPNDNAAQDLIATAVSNPAFEELAEELKRLFSNRMHTVMQESRTSAFQPPHESYKRLKRRHNNYGLVADNLSKELKRGHASVVDFPDDELNVTYHYGYMINQAKEGDPEILVIFVTDKKVEPHGIHIIELVGNYMEWYAREYGQDAQCTFTAADLLRVDEGKFTSDGLLDFSYKPDGDAVKRLERELEYYSMVNCKLDCTAENEERRIAQGTRHAARNIHKTYFCPLDIDIRISERNRELTVYKPLETPELFSYLKDKKGLKLIRTMDRVIPGLKGHNDIRGLAMDYFLAQIHLVNEVDEHGKRGRKPVFRLETVYKDGGIPTPEQRENDKLKTYKRESDKDAAIRKIAASDRRMFAKFFDAWTASGLILGWKWKRDPYTKEFASIEITPNPDHDIHRKSKEAPKEA